MANNVIFTPNGHIFTNGIDEYTATANNDSINSLGGDDTIWGMGGHDSINGGEGNDFLDGGTGEDTLLGGLGSDTIEGGEGADSMDGGVNTGAAYGAPDILSYKSDTTGVTINLLTGYAAGGHATGDTFTNFNGVTGGSGNDIITGNYTMNRLSGGAGNDTIRGNGGGDMIWSEDGNDAIYFDDGSTAGGNTSGIMGSNTGYGGAGNDTIIATGGDNFINGGAGADSMVGGSGTNDVLDYSDSAQAVYVSMTTGTGTGGDAQGDVFSGFESINGSNNSDELKGDNNVNRLLGNAGNDTLYGYGGNDYISAGEGSDVVVGGTGDDTLVGGSSYTNPFKPWLSSNAPNVDVAIYSGNLSDYTIVDFGSYMTIKDNRNIIDNDGFDTVSEFEYFNFNGVTLSKNDVLHPKYVWTNNNDAPNANLLGANESALGGDDLMNGSGISNVFNGNEGNDTIKGEGGNDFLYGDQGNDSLLGGEGNDEINGGADDDIIEGGVGSDSLNGGIGNDTLSYASSAAGVTVNLQADTVSGGDAQGDSIAAFDNVIGSANADHITGNLSNNTLSGGAGNDTLAGFGGASDRLNGGDGYDRAEFAENWDFYTATYDANTQEYTITEKASGNKTVTHSVEEFGFKDGTKIGSGVLPVITNPPTGFAWTTGNDNNGTTVLGLLENALAGNDTMNGSAIAQELNGGDGDDKIYGEAGNDTLKGDAGNDTIEGGAGADNLNGGAGIDTVTYITSTTAVNIDLVTNIASGGDAQGDTLSGFENVNGSNLNDTIKVAAGGWAFGNDGNDHLSGIDKNALGSNLATLLVGGNGDDTFVGGGNTGYHFDGGAGFDTAIFDNNKDDYTITYIASSNTYTVNDNFTGKITTTTDVEKFIFKDQTISVTPPKFIWTAGNDAPSAISLGAVENALAGNDIMSGSSLNNVFHGNEGDDTIAGVSGNDTLYGDEGNDLIAGGDGDDVVEGGKGADILSGDAGIDTLSYATSAAGVVIDLAANSASGGDAQGDAISGFENVKGSNFADYLKGNSANNILDGGDGDDTLAGANGADYLEGGNGFDTAQFKGNKADYTQAYNQATNEYTFTEKSTGIVTTTHLVEQIQFKDITTVLNTTTPPAAFNWTAGNDSNGAVVLGVLENALAGNDTMLGSAIAQELNGGDGNDIITGGDVTSQVKDFLYGGAGNDVITADDGNDWLYGDEGDDQLIGGSGNNVLQGGAGKDTISGGAGDDGILGGAGADVLDGGIGFDRVNYYESALGVSVNLQTQKASGGDAEGDIITNFEAVSGSNTGNDTLIASDLLSGDLFGNGGDDLLTGGVQIDVLSGGEGSDSLRGNAGNDTIQGGAGIDHAYFTGSRSDYTITFDSVNSLYLVTDNRANGAANQGTDSVKDIEKFHFDNGNQVIDVANILAIPTTAAFNWTAGNDSNGAVVLGVLENALAGNDTMLGSAIAQELNGGDGNDKIYGEAGNDTLSGGEGTDTVYGGAGNDVITADNGNDWLYGDDGNDQLIGGIGSNLMDGGVGNDTITGGAGYDIITGGAGADSLDGGADGDRVSYYSSAAGVSVNLQTQKASGGDAEGDVIANFEDVSGSNTGNDTLIASDLASAGLSGHGGDDLLTGGIQKDRLVGGEGSDSLRGNAGNDQIEGDAGIDHAYFTGSRSDYTITFDSVNNLYLVTDNRANGAANQGTDSVKDIEKFHFDNGNQVIDVANILTITKPTPPLFSFPWTTGNDSNGASLLGVFENALAGNDTMIGSTIAQILNGGDGDDKIYGEGGNDTLNGDAGNDTLEGGTGADKLNGGTGDNTLSYVKSAQAVTVNLLTNSVDGGEATGDIISAGTFKSVLGSNYNDFITLSNEGGLAHGYAGMDSIIGGAQNDTLFGDDGKDTVRGGAGNDMVYGGEGDDKLFGDAGNDMLFGGAGNDYLAGGLGNDTMFGGTGIDTVHYDKKFSDYIVTDLSGVIKITEISSGNVDLVSQVEFLQFSDIKYDTTVLI
jgi:Ca2+-binding RTX toxin-like protein